MPEPFKNVFNKKLVRHMAKTFQIHHRAFDTRGFIAAASKQLDELELKARSAQITDAMIQYLPEDFHRAAEILLASLGEPITADGPSAQVDGDDPDIRHGLTGWSILPMAHFVGLQGLDHFDKAMTLLKEMTRRFTSEFGIRFFLLAEPKKTLATLSQWTGDPDPHVRRLASEGSRPRLPWAMQLPVFIENPTPVIRLLQKLKDDPSEYVRRSVANNLNDISKDHPDKVAELAQSWMKNARPQRQKLVKHACRSLIKSGHAKTLRIFGYTPAKLSRCQVKLSNTRINLGEAIEFEVTLESNSNSKQNILVDFVIHHRKANGGTSPKVFKWRSAVLAPKETVSFRRKHLIRKVTTRVYYPGHHILEIMINGRPAGKRDFYLNIGPKR